MKSFVPTIASLLGASLLVLFFSGTTAAQERVTPDQSREIRRIKSGIDRAGRLFQSGKLAESAELVGALAADMEKLVEGAGDELLAAAKPQHDRLVTARKALVDAGQALPAVADLPQPSNLAGTTVSFSRDISPILVGNCGACHVARARGQFSMASFAALATGLGGSPVVVPGKPEESYLVEVISTGMMPPGGNRVAENDLARIRQWISEGAVYDGDDPARDLREMANAARAEAMAEANPEIAMATGNESVSFALDVAPVLVDNCVGCHFEAQNVRGGLMVNNFRQFLRGGDSGSLVVPGDGEGSLLVQRLRANDNSRMPQGRPPLEKAVVDRIVTWINEGARFDGRNPQMNLRELSAVALSEKSTPDELAAARADRARQTWRKVMLDVPAVEAESGNFHVLGTAEAGVLEMVADHARNQFREIGGQLGLRENESPVKGRTTLFVFESRYDFNEFGKMVENRDLPQSSRAHWNYDIVDAFVAVQITDGELGDAGPPMQQALAAIAVAAQGSDVPRWFADGAGFVIAESLVDNRPLLRDWQSAAAAATTAMQAPDDFLQGRIPQDQAALVAWVFVKGLFGNRRQFETFMSELREGKAFEEVFVRHFSAAPAALIERQSGNNRPGNRNRRGR